MDRMAPLELQDPKATKELREEKKVHVGHRVHLVQMEHLV